MALSYIGGKSRIAPNFIIPFIPKNIETYLEPFGGMFWTFFKMDIPQYPQLKKVVYNDYNPLNYNLFKCLQTPDILLDAVESIPCQQIGVYETPEVFSLQFKEFQKELFSPDFKVGNTDYVVAAKYAYILSQVFSGSKPETSSFIDLKGKYKSKYLTFRDKLINKTWIEHFLKITHIENMDFEEVIKKYDGVNTYIYLDPPYWKTENYYSNHDFDRGDHERLSNVLKNVESRFSLSYYDFELLRQWFPEESYRWEKKQFAKAAAAKKGEKQSMGEEVLIMNY